MWMEIQLFLPETLGSGELPGFEFLEIRETTLGEMPALVFEYRWDGVRPGSFGGDHACVVWALGPMTVYHVYHHCAGEVWEARRSGLDAILASFEFLRQGEDDEGEAAEGARLERRPGGRVAGRGRRRKSPAPEERPRPSGERRVGNGALGGELRAARSGRRAHRGAPTPRCRKSSTPAATVS